MQRFFTIIVVIALGAALVSACAPLNTAEQAVTVYLNALINKQYAVAAESLSDYSLEILGKSRADAQAYFEQIDQAGAPHLTGFKISQKQALNRQVTLIDVKYSLQTGDAEPITIDTQIPLRLENQTWKINWGDIVDDLKLDKVDAQTINGLRVKPTQVIRRIDSTQFIFDAENTTSQVINWGKAGAKIARITIDMDTVFEAFVDQQGSSGMTTPAEIQPGAKASGVVVNFTSFAANLPSLVELMNFSSTTPAGQVSQPIKPWSYSFKIN